MKICVPEKVRIFNEIREQLERIFEMIRVGIGESAGEYISAMMAAERTHFFGRRADEPME